MTNVQTKDYKKYAESLYIKRQIKLYKWGVENENNSDKVGITQKEKKKA